MAFEYLQEWRVSVPVLGTLIKKKKSLQNHRIVEVGRDLCATSGDCGRSKARDQNPPMPKELGDMCSMKEKEPHMVKVQVW